MTAMPDLTVTPAAQCGLSRSLGPAITPADVDVCQLYDVFTYTVVLTVEDLGFCAKGEGGAFVQDGGLSGWAAPHQHRRRRALGAIPASRGLFLLVEAARQLAARQGPPRSPTPASRWRTGPAACCRPVPPSCWPGRCHDRSSTGHRRAPAQAPPRAVSRRRLGPLLERGARRTPRDPALQELRQPAALRP